MTCNEWRLQTSSWEDGELETAGEQPLFSHLAACKECRLFSRRIRTVRRMLATGGLPHPESVAGKAGPETQKRKVVDFGSMFILAAFVASVVCAVMLLTTPLNSGAVPQKAPPEIMSGYHTLGHSPTRNYR